MGVNLRKQTYDKEWCGWMNGKLTCVSMIFFIFGIILGLFSALFHDYSAYFGFDPFDNSNPGVLFFFKHNLKVAFLLWSGAVTLGITTLVNLFSNGFIVGSAVRTVTSQVGLTKTLLLILPHGIFEIPGLIIAGIAGFKIPYELLKFVLGKKKEMITEGDAKEFFKLVAVSVVLIFIAAVIESTVTIGMAEKLDGGSKMLVENFLFLLFAIQIILMGLLQTRRRRKYHHYMELYRKALEEEDEKRARIYKSYAEEYSHWWFV